MKTQVSHNLSFQVHSPLYWLLLRDCCNEIPINLEAVSSFLSPHKIWTNNLPLLGGKLLTSPQTLKCHKIWISGKQNKTLKLGISELIYTYRFVQAIRETIIHFLASVKSEGKQTNLPNRDMFMYVVWNFKHVSHDWSTWLNPYRRCHEQQNWEASLLGGWS